MSKKSAHEDLDMTSYTDVRALMEEVYYRGGLNALFNDFPNTLGVLVMNEEDKREAALRAELEAAHQAELLLVARHAGNGVKYVD
ncbi:MAG TPA: hypothetical protein VF043_07715 [Ktedonobacteraceae bacterium]